MEIRAKQVILGVGEVIAAHNLLQHVRDSDGTEKTRMLAGGALAGMGYLMGPELEERIRGLRDQEFSESMKRQALYTAGGALLGSVGTYLLTKHGHNPTVPKGLDQRLVRVLQQADPAAPGFTREKPGGLLTIASVGFLGYSLFLDGKTPEEQKRHLWGLGAGAVGYMYGPEAIRKVKDLVVPSAVRDDAVELYARGSAAFGAGIGALAGWYLGGGLREKLFEVPDETSVN